MGIGLADHLVFECMCDGQDGSWARGAVGVDGHITLLLYQPSSRKASKARYELPCLAGGDGDTGLGERWKLDAHITFSHATIIALLSKASNQQPVCRACFMEMETQGYTRQQPLGLPGSFFGLIGGCIFACVVWCMVCWRMVSSCCWRCKFKMSSQRYNGNMGKPLPQVFARRRPNESSRFLLLPFICTSSFSSFQNILL